MITIAPGALEGDATVNIANLDPVSDIPVGYSAPEGFDFAAGIRIDTGGQDVSVPMQLAVRTGLAEGTQVWFFRADQWLDKDGNPVNVWVQEDSGIVDPDGYARTASPPYGGATSGGVYFIGIGYEICGVGGRVSLPILLVLETASMVGIRALNLFGTAIGVPLHAGIFYMALPSGPRDFEIVSVREEGAR